MLLELTEKWKLTTQNNAYDMEANQISKQNRYPCHNTRMVLGTNNDNSIEVKWKGQELKECRIGRVKN